jgi:hypothetical protein
MDLLPLMPLIGVFMFSTGVRHVLSPPGITRDRLLNLPFVLLVIPGLLTSFATLSEATPVQLLTFVCGVLGLVGVALSVSTMYSDSKSSSEPKDSAQRPVEQTRDA